MSRKEAIENSTQVAFAKFVIEYFHAEVNMEKVDWEHFVDAYSATQVGSVPGLMYINWVVSKHFNMDPYVVRTKKTRKREYLRPKHIAMYFAFVIYKYKQEDIADFFNLKEHSTVINGYKRVQDYIFTDAAYRRDIEQITNKLLTNHGQSNRKENERSSTEGSSRHVQVQEKRDSMPVYGNRKVESRD